MTIEHLRKSIPFWTFTALIAALASATTPALAGTTAADRARYQQERAVCLEGRSSQGQATCLKEAGAAFALAKQGRLDDPSVTFASNARQRCNYLPLADRPDCIALIDRPGASGAADDGVHELVTQHSIEPVPATPGNAGN
jgi:hypothetical protein